MNNPLLVTFHDIGHIPKIEALVQEKFAKLQSEKPDITKCHVFIEKTSKNHKTANSVIVRLDLKMPHIEDIIIAEKGVEDDASISSTVIKVFKRVHELMRERLKYLRDQKRVAKEGELNEQAEEVEV